MFPLSCRTTPYHFVSCLISSCIEPHRFLLAAVFLLTGLVLSVPTAGTRTAVVGNQQITVTSSGRVKPEGMAVDGAGYIYISESFNNRVEANR
jgi:hypothetical protein